MQNASKFVEIAWEIALVRSIEMESPATQFFHARAESDVWSRLSWLMRRVVLLSFWVISNERSDDGFVHLGDGCIVRCAFCSRRQFAGTLGGEAREARSSSRGCWSGFSIARGFLLALGVLRCCSWSTAKRPSASDLKQRCVSAPTTSAPYCRQAAYTTSSHSHWHPVGELQASARSPLEPMAPRSERPPTSASTN